jgi:type IV secretion system protein VirB5
MNVNFDWQRWFRKSAQADDNRADLGAGEDVDGADQEAVNRREDTKGNENPYLNARRTWNAHEGNVIASRRLWQIIGILALLIALAAVGGLISIGSQSRFVPYVVAVDKLGQALAVAPAERAAPVDQRVLHASVAQFIADARVVTPDVALQRKAVYRLYAMLAPKDPATAKMTEWLNGNEDASPFKRAATEMVSTDILSVLRETPESWQVEWTETTRDRAGILKGQPVRMRALVTVYTVPSTPDTTEEQIRNNPLGIFVRDFSWARQQ